MPLYWLSYGKLFFDPIYNVLFVWPLRLLARAQLLVRSLRDRRPGELRRAAFRLVVGSGLRSLQSGMVQFYALAMVWGVVVLVITLLVWPAVAANWK